MHEARWWHRLGPPLLSLTLVAAQVAGPSVAQAAYQGSIYSNITGFNECLGIVDSFPEKMRKAAVSAFVSLGYATTSFTKAGFTRSTFLTRTPSDWAVYVHSHGDYYGGKPGFRVDGGKCTQPTVVSSEIASRRSLNQRTNLVVMSMCHLGEAVAANDMPLAYAIEKVKGGVDAWRGPEFYLGYVGLQWDSDEFEFETLFWDALLGGWTVGAAFDRALAAGTYFAAFEANWWGSYYYNGLPGPWTFCRSCA